MRFEVWGDSHTDRIVGLGCREALTYLLNFDQTVNMVRNESIAGATVNIWIDEYLNQEDKAETLIVSSGFNEAAAVSPTLGFMETRDVIDVWYRLIRSAKEEGTRIIWVPTHAKGRGATDFPATADFRHLPGCLGAEVLNWNPAETDLCPDLVHYDYRTSFILAQKIIAAVKGSPGSIWGQVEEEVEQTP